MVPSSANASRCAELVVENDPLDACPTLFKPLGLAQVGAVDLRVVLNLARLLELGVELLLVVAISVVPVRFEEVSATLGQDDRDILAALHRNRADEALLAKVSKVAGSRIGLSAVMVAEVAR